MSIRKEVSGLRQDYQNLGLKKSQLHADPIQQFEAWFEEAVQTVQHEPNAMSLATVSEGRPSVRIVLLKGFDERGFLFYSNYHSKKGQDIEGNPQVALTFWWPELARQLRIEGIASQLSTEESNHYFQQRGRGSRIGAWASPQSQIIRNREELEKNVEGVTKRFEGQEVFPCPPHWGGYLVQPEKMEFWQGRSSRLHDRLVYEKAGDSWRIVRLAP
ncbi:MAG: pyridoxamine 5'-phosphate oxidase [Bacteroidota bacterium]